MIFLLWRGLWHMKSQLQGTAVLFLLQISRCSWRRMEYSHRLHPSHPQYTLILVGPLHSRACRHTRGILRQVSLAPLNPIGSPSPPCPPPLLVYMPTSQGYVPAFQSCVSPQPQPCVLSQFQAPLSPHQAYMSPPPLVLLPHLHASLSQQLIQSSLVNSSAPRSQPCSLLSRPSGVLPQQHAQELSQGLIQLFHPPGVSPLSETCSSQARSTSPCLMASPKTTKARYNFKGKKGPGSHRTHPQRSQCFTKEPLFGWHGAPAAIATLVPGGSSYERQSPEVYCAIQESELAVSTSQIPSHREVCLYQQNLRPELDNLEKRYSTSASTDPEHRVLQSNPMRIPTDPPWCLARPTA
ncbi:uncharacterized protein LOC143022663 isoform X2 [Oratosquilla oratoria]|uniref:uncharacterized protein LOC143022663 isoform X2 n=1 Tax=Oratosquilla oratoria TaxID=337810 RepID=UPI003F769F5B